MIPGKKAKTLDSEFDQAMNETAKRLSADPIRIGFELVHLDCLKDGCQTRPTSLEEFDVHMGQEHGIHPYRCPIYVCKASFADQ